jgi:hypothetical protein
MWFSGLLNLSKAVPKKKVFAENQEGPACQAQSGSPKKTSPALTSSALLAPSVFGGKLP